MCGIVLVAPVPEVDPLVVQLSHAVQPPALFQQRDQRLEFLIRMLKVFDHLTADDVVIGLEERAGVGIKKGVISGDFIVHILQQLADHRPGARTEVQAPVQYVLLIYNAPHNGIHKFLIARIVHVVFVSEIVSPFFFQRGVVFFGEQYRMAVGALHVLQASLGEVKEGFGGAMTEGAFQGFWFCNP